jgi:mRNA-degrading endonuclease RelE of RelBE toxin-antitoxin system
MNYNIIATSEFRKEIKRLLKKYHSLKKEYLSLIQSLEKTPVQGTSLGMDCYKIRLAIESKRKGKSGGARVITCVRVKGSTIYLITIFDKSEKDNISDKELKNMIRQIP